METIKEEKKTDLVLEEVKFKNIDNVLISQFDFSIHISELRNLQQENYVGRYLSDAVVSIWVKIFYDDFLKEYQIRWHFPVYMTEEETKLIKDRVMQEARLKIEQHKKQLEKEAENQKKEQERLEQETKLKIRINKEKELEEKELEKAQKIFFTKKEFDELKTLTEDHISKVNQRGFIVNYAVDDWGNYLFEKNATLVLKYLAGVIQNKKLKEKLEKKVYFLEKTDKEDLMMFAISLMPETSGFGAVPFDDLKLEEEQPTNLDRLAVRKK